MSVVYVPDENEVALRRKLGVPDNQLTQDFLSAWEVECIVWGNASLVQDALAAMQAGTIPWPTAPFTPLSAQAALGKTAPTAVSLGLTVAPAPVATGD